MPLIGLEPTTPSLRILTSGSWTQPYSTARYRIAPYDHLTIFRPDLGRRWRAFDVHPLQMTPPHQRDAGKSAVDAIPAHMSWRAICNPIEELWDQGLTSVPGMAMALVTHLCREVSHKAGWRSFTLYKLLCGSFCGKNDLQNSLCGVESTQEHFWIRNTASTNTRLGVVCGYHWNAITSTGT